MRNGTDLVMEKKIQLSEALLGFEVSAFMLSPHCCTARQTTCRAHSTLCSHRVAWQFAVRHLDERVIVVRSPPNFVADHNSVLVLEGAFIAAKALCCAGVECFCFVSLLWTARTQPKMIADDLASCTTLNLACGDLRHTQ